MSIDIGQCYEDPGPFGIAVALVIVIGTIISYIPQYRIIIKNRSSDGLNNVMLGISLMSCYLTATNSGILQWPLVTCCEELSFGGCLLNNLATEQLIISLLCVFILYFLCVLFYPEFKGTTKTTTPGSLNEIDVIGASLKHKNSKKFAWVLFFVVNIIGLFFSILGGVLFYNFHYSGHTLSVYATTLGILSSVGMILQWAPQIFTTIKNKSAGNLSLIMLAIQMPGALLVVFFQGFLMKANFSTWFPYIFSAAEMTILIVLIVVYMIRDRRKAKYSESAPLLKTKKILKEEENNNHTM